MSAATDLANAKAHGISVKEVGFINAAASNLDGAKKVGIPVKASQSTRNVTATAPSTPAAPVATAIAGRNLSVAFTPPASNGQPITSYTVTLTPGGATANGTSSPIIVGGGALTVSTGYTAKITATNEKGTSAQSPSSNSATAIA